MSKFTDSLATLRRELNEREEQAAEEMLRTWLASKQSVQYNLDNLIAKIEALGGEPTPVQTLRLAEWQLVMRQIDGEIERLQTVVNRELPSAQEDTVRITAQSSIEIIYRGMGPGLPESQMLQVLRFNPATVETLVASVREGTPLRSLLNDLKDDAKDHFTRVMASGLAKGESPRILGKELASALDLPIQRATTIARTEMNRTYRETALTTYKESTAVRGWRWLCARNARTCGMCLAMDGKEFPTDVPFGSHPNCRCSAVPLTKSWKEMGYPDIPDRRPTILPAHEWFEKQNDKTKLRILGPTKFQMYKDGELQLDDLIGYRKDKEWGPTRWERSLKQIRADQYREPGLHSLPEKSVSPTNRSKELLEEARKINVQVSEGLFKNDTELDNFLSIVKSKTTDTKISVLSESDMLKKTGGEKAVAAWLKDEETIYLNGGLWQGDLTPLNDYLKMAVEKGYHPQGADPLYVILHEEAHRLFPTSVFGGLRNEKARKLWSEYVVSVGGQDGVVDQIGKYAATSDGELVAEVYAMTHRGLPMSKEVQKLSKGLQKLVK